MCGVMPSEVIGAKSFTASNGRSVRTAGLTAKLFATVTSV